jgi:arginine/serine-rich splicing factor 7
MRSRSSSAHKDSSRFTQIYVARLHRATRESDLKDAFQKYGKLREVALKHTFAFLDFEEHESAVKAIAEMDRKTFVNGEQILVEQSVPGGKKRRGGGGGPPSKDDKCFNCNKRGHWAYECKSGRRRSRSRSASYNRRRYS